jgi:hypothetical protein
VSPTASASNDVPGENLISPLSIVKTLAGSTIPLITGLLLETATDPSETSDRVSPISTSVSFARTSNDLVSFSPAEPVSGLATGGSLRPLTVTASVLWVTAPRKSVTSKPNTAESSTPCARLLNRANPAAVNASVEPANV